MCTNFQHIYRKITGVSFESLASIYTVKNARLSWCGAAYVLKEYGNQRTLCGSHEQVHDAIRDFV